MGMIMYSGVDYQAILEQAQEEADVIIWDGGNNDFSFYKPDLAIVVVDPLRPGHALHYHPGEANLRMADVVVVNKMDTATSEQVSTTLRDIEQLAPLAAVVRAASPVTLDEGPSLKGEPVLVIDDGPTITHGGMPYGAGLVAAWQAGAKPIDPRPYAVGSIAATLRKFPHIMEVLPAMGYGDEQLRELEATIEAAECAAVVAGTPIDLQRIIRSRHPFRHVTYTLAEIGSPDLAQVLQPIIAQAELSAMGGRGRSGAVAHCGE
jgi:predicted GTPase